MNIKTKSFTLIELLIVIVIIGILATSLIPRIVWMQDRARKTAMTKNFQDFQVVILMAQTNSKKSLKDITWSSWTSSICDSIVWKNVKNIPSSHFCRQTWVAALRAIELAAEEQSWSLSFMEKDPRGSPYLLDENEWVSNTMCVYDTLSSAWPNGIIDGIDRHDATNNSWDNIGINIPWYHCAGAY